MTFSDKAMARLEALFFTLFLAIMVRINFGAADSEEARLGRLEAAANGDATKQLIYAIIFLLFIGLWLWLKGARMPRCVSILQIIFLVWVATTTSWAYYPEISFRRMVLLCMTLISLALSIDFLGPSRTLNVLYKGLAVVITFSLISVFLFPSFAVHPATETDPSIVGGWRGVFLHKNTAGAVCAVAVIVFTHYAVTLRRKRDWFFLFVCLFFLIGSKSKTPLGLLAIVIPLGFYYRAVFSANGGRIWFILTVLFVATLLAVLAFGYQDLIARVLDDPTSFTGRVAIWDTAIAFAKDHFWTGSGYSSLWGTGNETPAVPYLEEAYVEFTVHSHSGYIELFATTGLPGLCLAVLAAVILPFYQFVFCVDKSNAKTCSLLFSIWFFAVLQNLMETQLYSRDREVWFMMLSAVLSMHLIAKTRVKGRAESPIVSRRPSTTQPVAARPA
ncbi:O-antigen ligase family protein [Aureimonas sp. ME7]|uniref:O-antigen ligase family protein n=1 Tax=Aureimonas sp. ME7 TaxID=2744252 RepID=UPI0015FE1718|nr:O-antigen ligase family protein [Aureimonas sp. ME7]